MVKLEEIQKRIKAAPDRKDIKTCLRESYSMVRAGDALLSIKFLLVGIFGIIKIKDLTKPERKIFNEDISKSVSGIDLLPIVKEATEGEMSLITTFEEKGLKELVIRLQSITGEMKKIEQAAIRKKAAKQEQEVKKVFSSIGKELDKGNVAAAKAKADRLLGKDPKQKSHFLEEIINIFEEKSSLKGWWHYFQMRYDPDKCSLEEAKYCAAKVAKMRSLDDPGNSKSWYRNNLDYRLKVWELMLEGGPVENDSVIEACYNLAICVYYCRDNIRGKSPKSFGHDLIEEGLKYAPDSPHLKKMGKTFGVRV
ncbi:hypothetical protein [Maridesulfovibrio sp.]|uniref:hypothetical protein n=1 Tax=Maridesulfovibrio sp. TaxID=2795000 RepID=UPI0029CA7E1F|nr:hypothetical protein [Maridesulfovibrio sp.]